ncbi:hypothetical protein IGI04_027339 [Brassica rapa subsp. trilocularis]|uniref:Uncharacterized protein n=2 Tax=Brassica campestris TaxID=3711 RepID=M4EI66_BRACM|nr:hypothetical protein IGI04_027339 [Brassica rapa subsp. trilocularis]
MNRATATITGPQSALISSQTLEPETVIGFLVAKERNEFLMLSFVKATKERSTDMQPADMMHPSGSTELYKHLYLDYPRRRHKQHPDL